MHINSFREGKNYNLFIEEEGNRYHLIVADEGKIIVCTAAGNSGIALDFSPFFGAMEVGEYGGLSSSQGTWGIWFDIRVRDQSFMKFRSICMDSVRAIRDLEYEEATQYRELVSREYADRKQLNAEGFVYPIMEREGNRRVRFYRFSFDGKTAYELEMEFEGEVECESCEGDLFPIIKWKEKEQKIRIIMKFKRRKEMGLATEKIFQDDFRVFFQNISSHSWYYQGMQRAKEALNFLSFKEKIVAGSYRFLTYFGRDSLLSFLLLQPVTSSDWHEVAIQSVLDRLSPLGWVAHEEDVGDQAVFRRIELIRLLSGLQDDRFINTIEENLDNAVYDYKMVDDDFLLPLAFASWFWQLSPEHRKDFLFKDNFSPHKKNIVAILKNMDFCLSKAAKFGLSSSWKDLVGIKDIFVGDWRDSSQGLGFGKYPYSVNGVFVPVALQEIKRFLFSEDAIVFRKFLLKNKKKFPSLMVYLNEKRMDQLILCWENAKKYYQKKITAAELFDILVYYKNHWTPSLEHIEKIYWQIPKEKYAKRRWIKEELLRNSYFNDRNRERENREIQLLFQQFPSDKKMFCEWFTSLRGKEEAFFYALSLDEKGNKVDVLHSDLAFALFFGELSEEELEDIIFWVTLPYPAGLATPYGIVVANPALSSDEILFWALDRRAYHGSVVWGWQMVMFLQGFLRQYKLFKERNSDSRLMEKIERTLALVWDMLKNAVNFSTSELWSWRVTEKGFEGMAYGVEGGSATESNPYQLWSSAFLSAVYSYEKFLQEKGGRL